ncbi:ACT domain-containing protein [Microbacterium sp. KSW4-17]|uniref:ACT domain-containing protein n=1 Tax=Microbacterium galbum TaxID=3075994 RepID=A0ABU3T2M6_9MICO|nr:ACT domain-containing protein [Microbacterium sp. KSW4-17]MDU0365620.1 ACT domain-containing protein [Microbacterium sp. KSW4-17]
MTTLVLTIVGDDRAGLVSSVADIVDAHGGNWENSELAELAGAFAGIVEVSIAADGAAALRAALEGLAGTLAVTVHAGAAAAAAAAAARTVTFDVVGNDRPGIVRELSTALSAQGASIERMSTQTTDAAMAGGRLFEASITATLAATVVVDDLVAELERLATEIQVDVTLSDEA